MCPVAVRLLSKLPSDLLSAPIIYILIFRVITYSYNSQPMSGLLSNHLFGFKPGQKPRNCACRPAPFSRKIVATSAQLASFKRDNLPAIVKSCWLPCRVCYQPNPCSSARQISLKKRVIHHLAIDCYPARHDPLSPSRTVLHSRAPIIAPI